MVLIISVKQQKNNKNNTVEVDISKYAHRKQLFEVDHRNSS